MTMNVIQIPTQDLPLVRQHLSGRIFFKPTGHIRPVPRFGRIVLAFLKANRISHQEVTNRPA